MRSHIKQLYDMSQRDYRTIVGLMSGTSLDGLDIALCRISGHGRNTSLEVRQFTTIPYTDVFRKEVRKVFSVKEGNIELLVLLHAQIGRMHGVMVRESLEKWGIDRSEVDVIASHGQTMYHAPAFIHKNPNYGHATLQIGDADHISFETGIVVVGDFRMKHIAAGGEGAPLAVYGDYLIFSDAAENRVMLNIGGIANFTWLPSASAVKKWPSFSTDAGPGNTMMDAFAQKYLAMDCDTDGRLAAAGKVNQRLLQHMLSHDFFQKRLPKTIGPELFNLDFLNASLAANQLSLSQVDIMATLNLFSATAIVESIKANVPGKERTLIYASGGGVHNPVMMDHISKGLSGMVILPMSKLGIDADAKEAVLFALLANECIAGTGMDMPLHREGMPDVSMGKISFPD